MIKKAGIGFMSGLMFALFAYSSAFAGPTEIKLKKGNAYVSINAGLTILNDIDFGSDLSYAGITANATGTASFDPGGSVGVAIGYIVSDHFRTEFELGYTKMDHDQVEGSATLTAGGSTLTVSGQVDVDGSVEAVYGLANFILTPFGSIKNEFLGASFTPLVGVGLGFTSWEDYIYVIGSGEGTGSLLVDGEESDTDFLSALMLGLEHDASESVSWTVKYRHFWANSGKNGVENSEGENLVANVRISF